MRVIFFSLILCFSTLLSHAQTVFDTATCGGINKLSGYSAEKIFVKSREWAKENIQPLAYTENETNGTIMITALENYNARAADKLPAHYSGKFEYTFLITSKEGFYSYDFVNVKYIPANKLKEAMENREKSDHTGLRIKRKTWDKISRSAFRQLQEKGKKYDAFMQKC